MKLFARRYHLFLDQLAYFSFSLQIRFNNESCSSLIPVLTRRGLFMVEELEVEV